MMFNVVSSARSVIQKKFLSSSVVQSDFVSAATISKDIIDANLQRSRQHLTPELDLYLLTSSCPMYHAPADHHPLASSSSDPWWAIYWPGGQVLARIILDNPNLVRNKMVLDLGSGCGAVSLAAALAGAKKIVANDIDVNASTALHMNSEINNLEQCYSSIEFTTQNFLFDGDCESLENFDTLVIGDMFYDQDIGKAVLDLCQRFKQMSPNKTVLVGDPGRWFMKSSNDIIDDMFECCAKYSLPEVTRQENYGFDHALVWKMK